MIPENIKKIIKLEHETSNLKDEIIKSVLNDDSISQEAKNKFFSKIKELENIKISQDEYIKKYKHLDILKYDVETFMPIYKGIKKWSER